MVSGDPAATSVEHCLSVYEWICHVHLRRVVCLARNYNNAIKKCEIILDPILGRALIETIASFHKLLNDIDKLMKIKKYPEVYHLISSYLAIRRDKKDIKMKLKQLNVLDALRDIDKKYEVVMGSYEWLSEFAHPNSLGMAVAFSKLDPVSNRVRFNDGRSRERFSPILEPAILLPIFKEDWLRKNEIGNLIRNDWKPSSKVCDLFKV